MVLRQPPVIEEGDPCFTIRCNLVPFNLGAVSWVGIIMSIIGNKIRSAGLRGLAWELANTSSERSLCRL